MLAFSAAKRKFSLFHLCADFQFQSAERECSVSNLNFTKKSTHIDEKSHCIVARNRGIDF